MIAILRLTNLVVAGFLVPAFLTPALAQPIITSLVPTANQQSAPRTTPVTVRFNQSLGTSSTGALRVFSNQRGGLRTAGSGATLVNGSDLTFNPTYAFWPGETVMTTVGTAAQSSSGMALALPQVFQFTAAVTGGSGSFTGGSSVSVGGAPYIVVTADVDNDGDLDLITPNFYSSTVSIRLNNGGGSFTVGSDPAVGSQPRGVVMVDFDGDGDLDFATSNYNDNTVSIRLNNGSGVFSGNTNFRVGSRPQSIVAADLDGDGDLDLLSSNEVGATVSIRVNNGNATFSSLPDVVVSSFPFSITVGDVDGDGDIDLIAGNYTGSTVSISLNDGSGRFNVLYDVNVGGSPRGVSVADVDGDGDLDLLAANVSNNTVSVRLNNGTGLFSGSQNVGVGFFPGSVTTGDVDGDGDLDILASNALGNTVSLRLNNGAGGFSSSGSDTPVGNQPYRVAMADLDGDGDLDMLTSNFGDNTVSVRINQAPIRVTIAGDSTVCSGGQVQLTANTPAPVTAYRWSTGATTQSITVNTPGTYSVTATFAGGLTSTDQHIVRAINPTVQITGDTILCGGSLVTLWATSAMATSYRWSTGATTATITVAQPGIYSVTASIGTGCTATAQVSVRAPSAYITGVPVLCLGSSTGIVLTAVAPGATSLRWNTGATTANLMITQPGNYNVVATFSGGCTLTASQTVTTPTVIISGDSLLCVGRPTQLSANVFGTTGSTYLWNTGATTASINVTQAGIYSVIVGYGTGCTIWMQQRVRPGVTIPAFALGADTTLCEGEQLVLRAPTAINPGIAYRWSDGSSGSTLRAQQSGTYSLELISTCETRTVSRRINFQPCLTIPTIITANEDGQNDRFKILGLTPGRWALEVYTRWGKKVYETQTYPNDWGATAAPGVYYYLLRLPNTSTSFKGWVEVVR